MYNFLRYAKNLKFFRDSFSHYTFQTKYINIKYIYNLFDIQFSEN